MPRLKGDIKGDIIKGDTHLPLKHEIIPDIA